MSGDNILIDSHYHIMSQRRLWSLVRWIKGAVPDHPVPESVTKNDLLHTLARESVTHFFNLVYPLKEEETDPLNAFNGAFCKDVPGAMEG